VSILLDLDERPARPPGRWGAWTGYLPRHAEDQEGLVWTWVDVGIGGGTDDPPNCSWGRPPRRRPGGPAAGPGLRPYPSQVLTALAHQASRPNVLIIRTDDQRYSTLDVMHDTRAWFRTGGTRFTRRFVNTPLCCPSRSSIFTGRYAHNHGVRTNPDAKRLLQYSTVQRYLRDAGYRTAIAGRYLPSWPLGDDPPHFRSLGDLPHSDSSERPNSGLPWHEFAVHGSPEQKAPKPCDTVS
jgi:hypothetical protein